MYKFFSLFIRTRFRRHHRSHGTILFPQRPALSPRRHRRRERLPALSLSLAPRSIPHHALSLATTHPRPRRYYHDIQASLTAPNVPPSGTMISLLTLIIRMVLHRLRTPPRTPSLLVARCLPLCLPPPPRSLSHLARCIDLYQLWYPHIAN